MLRFGDADTAGSNDKKQFQLSVFWVAVSFLLSFVKGLMIGVKLALGHAEDAAQLGGGVAMPM